MVNCFLRENNSDLYSENPLKITWNILSHFFFILNFHVKIINSSNTSSKNTFYRQKPEEQSVMGVYCGFQQNTCRRKVYYQGNVYSTQMYSAYTI